ncbi:MAG: hypothetical protein U0V70_01555 [Terriglobia bacterium]
MKKTRDSLHQLNNKVAQILAYAELLQLSLHGDKEKERINLVVKGALEARVIIASLMTEIPRIDPQETHPFNPQ